MTVTAILDSRGQPWREWILINVDRGCTEESMLEAMQTAWTLEDAKQAINNAFSILANPALSRPLIDTSKNFIDVAGHSVQVLFSLKNPHIVLINNILTHDECDLLVHLAKQKGLDSSCVVDQQSGEFIPHQGRTSSSCCLSASEGEIIQILEFRLSSLNNWPLTHAEGIQILQYTNGQQYRPHMDWFDPANPGTAKQMTRGGQRVGTYVVYLTDVEAGGSTIFPKLGVEVFPKKGSTVFFSNIDDTGKPNPDTLHGGSPVISGTKLVATYWQREFAYK